MSNEPDYIYPEAYQAISFAAFERAMWLNRCAHAARYEAIHGAPASLTPEQKQQRAQLVEIVAKVLEQGRDREMDLAVAHWKTYRSMEPS